MPRADHWFLLDAYFKLHASVRHAHYGIEAARRIRDKLGGETRSITAIRLETYAEAVTYAGNRAPRAPIQAQFSVSFGVAAGLRFGGMEADTYRAPKFEDAELRRLESLIDLQARPARPGAMRELTVIAGGQTHRCAATESPAMRACRSPAMRSSRSSCATVRARPGRKGGGLRRGVDGREGKSLRALWALLD